MNGKPWYLSRTILLFAAVLLCSVIGAVTAVLANAPEWTPQVLALAAGAGASSALAILMRLVTSGPIEPPSPGE